ncbi:MAG: hypothetical protein ABFD65_01995 [Candidatus Polarisedimenticolia bacterium]
MTRPTITAATARRVARLARLALAEGEAERYARDIEAIVRDFARLEAYDVGDAPQDGAERNAAAPAATQTGVPAPDGAAKDGSAPAPDEGSALRADEPLAGLGRDETARLAPRFAAGHFIVPRVVR